jgi:hypothetical protein
MSSLSLGGGGVAQLQPGENENTFDHCGETDSELKLTAFQEKRG